MFKLFLLFFPGQEQAHTHKPPRRACALDPLAPSLSRPTPTYS